MDPRLNDDEIAVQERALQAARGVAAAGIDAGTDDAGEALAGLAAAGLLGTGLAQANGGTGGGPVEVALVCEAVGATSATVGVVLAGHLVAGALVAALGDATQRDAHLGGIGDGTTPAAFAVDVGDSLLDSPGTGVTADDGVDGLTLNGRARGVVGAALAKILVVPVRAGDATRVAVVPIDAVGMTVGPVDELMGLSGSGQATVSFDDVAVDAGGVLAGASAAEALEAAADLSRVGNAAVAVGLGNAALAAATAHAKGSGGGLEREQSVQWMLADIATETEAARLLCWYAATRSDAAERREAAAMARLLAAEAAVNASRRAVQILGPAGARRDAEVSRLYRDAQAMEGHQGAPQSQRREVARQLLPDLFEAAG